MRGGIEQNIGKLGKLEKLIKAHKKFKIPVLFVFPSLSDVQSDLTRVEYHFV